MVEAGVEIRFTPSAEATFAISTNVDGQPEQQAELVTFALYAIRVILLLEEEVQAPLVHSLRLLENASTEHLQYLARGDQSTGGGLRSRFSIASPDRPPAARRFRATLRFVSGRSAPRFRFATKPGSVPPGDRGAAYDAAASVLLFLSSLLELRADDPVYLRRLATTAGLVGRLAEIGWVEAGTEFDLALAAADVAWRSTGVADSTAAENRVIACTRCRNRGYVSARHGAFELRLWPSESDLLRKCRKCGAGIWVRGRASRTVPTDIWSTMERVRSELETESRRAQIETGPAAATGENGRGGLLHDLIAVFTEQGWPFDVVRGAPVLVSELSGPLETWKFFAQVIEEQRRIAFYSVCPITVPEGRRPEVADFLTRANYGLANGNFELDFEDGEIRFKTVLEVDESLSPRLVKKVVRFNGLAMETYLPGIAALVTGMPALPTVERRGD